MAAPAQRGATHLCARIGNGLTRRVAILPHMRPLHSGALVCSLAVSMAVPLAALPSADEPVKYPAAFQKMLVPSHGSNLLGVMYLAAGAGPHPTAILFHGYPGYEQNLDLAQALRTHGWNVLAMHYRGSRGVKGDFSFAHAAEDADTQVSFLLDPANVQKYRIDPHHVTVMGHSMGGYMAASAIAHNPQVAGAVLISAWNIGADYETHRHVSEGEVTIENEAKGLGDEANLAPLSGTNASELAREIHDHQKELNLLNLVSAITPRPVYVITANEGLAPSDHALVEALRKSGDTRVTEQHWESDHSYSGVRPELIDAIERWFDGLPR
jgi:pimeloyl-ACP methyl ester carboxylesterase